MPKIVICAKEIKLSGASQVGIFVVHNKLKDKEDNFDDEVIYFTGKNIPDKWVIYPWEAENIIEHDQKAKLTV